jgi:hypothetical protein
MSALINELERPSQIENKPTYRDLENSKTILEKRVDELHEKIDLLQKDLKLLITIMTGSN